MSADLNAEVAARFRAASDAAAALCDDGLAAQVAAAANMLIDCYRGGGKVLVCGNGGSAAQASHIAAELVGRYLRDRPPLPALALAENESSLTAISNDYGYAQSFARQVEAYARPGDIVIGLTTSGKSANVIAALRTAREREARTIAVAGPDASELGEVADQLVLVPAGETPRIQEAHLVIGHTLCELVEAAMFAT